MFLMASRSSQSGRRPRRPGERTEKERRAPQGPPEVKGGHPGVAGHGGHAVHGGHGGHAGGRAAEHGPSRSDPGAPRPGRQPGAARGADQAPGGMVLIYGRNPVREALDGRRRVHTVWLAQGRPGDELESDLDGWIAGGSGVRPDTRRASSAQLTSMAGSPEHQGIVAGVDPYPYLDPGALLQSLTLLVALDEVQDPHNLGAVIRTAEGAGAGVVIPRHRAAEITAAVVKASAGATEHASVAQVRNLADFLATAKERGFWIYGAVAGAHDLYTTQDYRYPSCFVLGSEGRGLGKRVESLCDVLIGLPLKGEVGSLNVSVSAGILLYEAVRQREPTGGGTLPGEDRSGREETS